MIDKVDNDPLKVDNDPRGPRSRVISSLVRFGAYFRIYP